MARSARRNVVNFLDREVIFGAGSGFIQCARANKFENVLLAPAGAAQPAETMSVRTIISTGHSLVMFWFGTCRFPHSVGMANILCDKIISECPVPFIKGPILLRNKGGGNHDSLAILIGLFEPCGGGVSGAFMGTTYTLPQMMAYQLRREIVPMRGRGRTVRLRPHHELVSV